MSRIVHRALVGAVAAAVSLAGAPQSAHALFGLFDCSLFRPQQQSCAPPPSTCGVPPVGAPGTIARYIPTTAYRRELVSVPVTTFRPVNGCDPATGLTTTSLQPVQVMVSQVQMVPYTTYRVVSANPCGTASCNVGGAVPAVRAMYAPTAAFTTAGYNQAAWGVAPTTTVAPQTVNYAPTTALYAQSSCSAPVAAAPSGCSSCNSAPAPYYTPSAPRGVVPNSSTIAPSIPRATPVPPATVVPGPVGSFAPAPAGAAPTYSAPATGGSFAAPPTGGSFNNGTFTPQRPILPAAPSSGESTSIFGSTTGATTGTTGPAATGSSLGQGYNNAPVYPPAWSSQQPAPGQLPQYQNGAVLQDRESAPPRSASNLPGRFASQQRTMEGDAAYAAYPNQPAYSNPSAYANPSTYANPPASPPPASSWPGVDDSGWAPASRSW